MHRDGMRKATAQPVGGEDAFKAHILNALCDRAYREWGLDELVGDEFLEDGYHYAEGNLKLDVRRDPENPAAIKGNAYRLCRYEVLWDPSSRKSDRSDAGHVFVSRWLSKGQFTQLYPDKAEKFEELKEKADRRHDSFDAWQHDDHSEIGSLPGLWSDYWWSRQGRHYFEASKNKIRVIQGEFKIPEKRYWLMTAHGEAEPLSSKAVADAARKMIELGMDEMQGAQVVHTWVEKVYILDFVANDILHEGQSFQPFDGFSVVGWAYAIDSETGASYGPMRNLFDPQMEVNKAWTSGLEQFTGQSKPGVIAEEQAIPDIAQFEENYRISGGVSLVGDGKLSSGAVQERQTAAVSPATQQRLQNSVEMVDRICGLGSDADTPAAHAEAAVTQVLRYHRARQAQSSVFSTYDRALVSIYERVAQSLLRLAPDRQLAEMLGNDDKYAVQADPQTGETVIIEFETDEQGQRRPTNMASMPDFRSLRHDVELEVTSENTTARLMESSHLAELASAGVPVDPTLLVEKATPNRHERERLVNYAEEKGKAEQAAAQMEQQASMATIQQSFAIEAQRNEEAARHNRVEESLKAQKQQQDFTAKLAGTWESADATEKQALTKVLDIIERRQQARTVDVQRG